jgi:hypothetical protein
VRCMSERCSSGSTALSAVKSSVRIRKNSGPPAATTAGIEMRPLPRYFDYAESSGAGNCQGNELSRERCNGDVVSVLPTHRKIHLRVRADKRRHEIILVKSVFSTNHLKGRRVCDDAS